MNKIIYPLLVQTKEWITMSYAAAQATEIYRVR